MVTNHRPTNYCIPYPIENKLHLPVLNVGQQIYG